MFKRVELCGVDTSALKLLTEEEKAALLRKVKAGDMAAREELITGNLRLVLSVIQKFEGRGDGPEDLFQVGCVGLMKAIDNFDVSQDVRFSTYAVPMIIGEIRRHLRDNNPVRVSRSVRDTAYHAMQAKEELGRKLGRTPTTAEVARELGIAETDVVLALEAIVSPVSFYEPVYAGGGDTIYLMDQLGGDESDGDWVNEISLKEALKNLPEREKKILSLRYMYGLTQTEVAKEIGISQAQVSRLEKSAIDTVKRG